MRAVEAEKTRWDGRCPRATPFRGCSSNRQTKVAAMKLDKIEEIIEDIRLGKMVVLIDDEDRENEGDLVMAAQHVTDEHINFMARFARGLICMPMSKQQADRLGLRLMVEGNGSGFGTKFTASIEASTGVTTGISAADRARTVQVAANPHAKADDIVQP